MTSGRTVVRSAPGKLFVAGEYAVVEPGTPAILVAVDREITVLVSGSGEADVVISSDLGARAVCWQWQDGRLDVHGEEDSQGARVALAHVVSAIETVAGLLAERGLPVPPLSISVSSRLHENGRKFGLGSSGAVTVATVDAVASFCDLELSLDSRFRLAMIAGARIDPKGSGGDLAASTWGGWIAYQAPDRDFVLGLALREGIEEALRAPGPVSQCAGFRHRPASPWRSAGPGTRLPPPRSCPACTGGPGGAPPRTARSWKPATTSYAPRSRRSRPGTARDCCTSCGGPGRSWPAWTKRSASASSPPS